jgi:hypothetical protein
MAQVVSREAIDEALSNMDEGAAPALQDQAEHWTWFVKDVEMDEDVRIAHCTVVLVFEDVEVVLP